MQQTILQCLCKQNSSYSNMNPLSASLIFVIGYILLSFLKNLIFTSYQPPNSTINFSKVFQLTNNKPQYITKHYKSLFEAYHKYEIQDAQKITNLLPNRQMFNQSVLADTLRNQQSFFICGSQYFVIFANGIVFESGETKWVSKFQIYKLPLLTRIKVIEVNEKLILPKKCKQNIEENFYYLYMVDNGVFLRLKIIQDQVTLDTMIPSKGIDAYIIQGFEFQYDWVAYWSQKKPWLLNIQNFPKENSIIKNTNLQINLLQLKKQFNQTFNSAHRLQQINIHQLLLIKIEGSLQLAAIYSSHQFGNLFRSRLISTFIIKNKNINNIQSKNQNVENEINWIDTSYLDGQYASYQHNQCECELFMSLQREGASLSCLIDKINLEKIKFIIKHNIFNLQKQEVPNYKQTNTQLSQLSFFDQILLNIESQQQQDYLDSFIQYFIQNTTQNQQKTKEVSQIIFYLPISPYLQKKIIKSSTPNPIIFYSEDNIYYLYAFNLPQTTENNSQNQISQMPFINFALQPPPTDKPQQKILRQIKWIEDQNLIIVIWGSGIEVYKFLNFEVTQDFFEGIAMSTILPFIQLFATTFCLLRML